TVYLTIWTHPRSDLGPFQRLANDEPESARPLRLPVLSQSARARRPRHDDRRHGHRTLRRGMRPASQAASLDLASPAPDLHRPADGRTHLRAENGLQPAWALRRRARGGMAPPSRRDARAAPRARRGPGPLPGRLLR